MDLFREISHAATIKPSRYYTDFLADRITQAATCGNLPGAAERLMALLGAEAARVDGPTLAAFMGAAAGSESVAVLKWLARNCGLRGGRGRRIRRTGCLHAVRWLV